MCPVWRTDAEAGFACLKVSLEPVVREDWPLAKDLVAKAAAHLPLGWQVAQWRPQLNIHTHHACRALWCRLKLAHV